MVIVGIQARMSSTRLPGKVLRPLADRPMILQQMDRVARTPGIDHLILLTSTRASDDPLAQAVSAAGHQVLRGPLDDVLARYALLECLGSADWLIRMTGDCPLSDPEVIAQVIGAAQQADTGIEYISNTLEYSWPDGLDVEAFRPSALVAANQQAEDPADREHVTPWMRRNCRSLNVSGPADFSRLRWTIDYSEDFDFADQVFRKLQATHGNQFGWLDVVALLLREPRLIRYSGVTP